MDIKIHLTGSHCWKHAGTLTEAVHMECASGRLKSCGQVHLSKKKKHEVWSRNTFRILQSEVSGIYSSLSSRPRCHSSVLFTQRRPVINRQYRLGSDRDRDHGPTPEAPVRYQQVSYTTIHSFLPAFLRGLFVHKHLPSQALDLDRRQKSLAPAARQESNTGL
jgi:hypothetical protein